MQLVGRKDDQIKIRGIRVDPKEIEATITQFEDVKDAAIVYNTENDTLIAFISGNENLDISSLKNFCIDKRRGTQ